MSNQQGWTSNESFDWDQTSDAPPPPLEDGIYRCTIVKAEAEPTGKQQPGVALQLQATHKHGEAEGSLSRKLFDKLVLTKETAFRVKQAASAAGVTPPPSSSFDDVTEFAGSLVGIQVWVRTKQQTYQGKTNARVDMYIKDEKLQEVLGGGAAASNEPAAAPARRKRGAAA